MFRFSRVFTMTTTRLITFLCFALACSPSAFSTPADDAFEHAQMQATESELRRVSQRIATAIEADPIASPGQVVVVYFTPADIEPAANHCAGGLVATDVQFRAKSRKAVVGRRRAVR